MDEYVYIDETQYDKFSECLETYEEWRDLIKYLDDNHPLRMDDYDKIIRKRIEYKNVIYKLLNIGFLEIESSTALAYDLVPFKSDNQMMSSDMHATIQILDEKKWLYFKLKAEL